jgi:regulatory protein YycH of two-component signal transduction system YycFG
MSIIGIIVSTLGILLSLIIFHNIWEFQNKISDLYWNKNDKIYNEISDLMINHLEIVRETIPPVLIVFFSFFLILSIKVNRRF